MTLDEAVKEIKLRDEAIERKDAALNRIRNHIASHDSTERWSIDDWAKEALKPPTRKVRYACACVELPQGFTVYPLADSVAVVTVPDNMPLAVNRRVCFDWRIEEKEVPL